MGSSVNWSVILSALAVMLTIIAATAKNVAAWAVAAHQLQELRETMAKTLERLGKLEYWRERKDGKDEALREMSGVVRG